MGGSNAERADERARSHSGRLLLRMPKTLHADLAARSDADGVSLNQYIVSTLARAVSGEEPEPGSELVRDDRSLRTALLVNAVVVAIAAIAAIVVLIVALR
jgi:hypothetical protein